MLVIPNNQYPHSVECNRLRHRLRSSCTLLSQEVFVAPTLKIRPPHDGNRFLPEGIEYQQNVATPHNQTAHPGSHAAVRKQFKTCHPEVPTPSRTQLESEKAAVRGLNAILAVVTCLRTLWLLRPSQWQEVRLSEEAQRRGPVPVISLASVTQGLRAGGPQGPSTVVTGFGCVFFRRQGTEDGLFWQAKAGALFRGPTLHLEFVLSKKAVTPRKMP